MRLLFVTKVDSGDRVYRSHWRSAMRLLLVSKLHSWGGAVSTITRYTEVGRTLGHEVAVFGEQLADIPVPCSLDVEDFDYAVFVIYGASDFPDLPYLARLLDGLPKDRRVIIDCCGRYNDTIRVEHDFNHLERLDGHQGWEWIEGFEAVSDRILQPTLTPRRDDVIPFLFHGFDPGAVSRPAALPISASGGRGDATSKPYGAIYVGNNWQRWSQIAAFLEAVEPIKDKLGPICLSGWDWDKRPDWAVEHGVRGVDVDPELLRRLDVETKYAIPFHEVIDFLGQARFGPVFQRPLFNHLGLVTNRTFETLCADTIPLLMLPGEMVEAIHGPDARSLVPDGDVAGRLEDMIARPEAYWDAVANVRAHLAEHRSYGRRFEELLGVLGS